MKAASEDELITHCRAIAGIMPLVGLYLKPAVGGIKLSGNFWRRLAEIDQVVVIKIAPFNRYHTLDVIKGVVAARAEERITLYTGNDDSIVLDLLTPFVLRRDGADVTLQIKGGLLGHWIVWTKGAVDLLTRIQHSIWCLDPKEGLSPGQAEEIGRVMRLYPELGDDSFVATNPERWLS